MIYLIATGCLSLGLAQGQGPVRNPADPAQAPVEVTVDGVAAVVGDQIVTLRELDEFVAQRANAVGLSRQEDLARIRLGYLEERYLLLLKVQAGQDMGFDPELVRRGEQRLFAEEVELRGGPVAASKQFAALGQRPEQLQKFLRRRLYIQSWEWAQTGRAAGASGRVSVDRNLRPGQNWSAYQLALKSPDPAERAMVGMMPPQVVLQQLVLPIEENGGEESTLELARTLIEEARSGTDFTDLTRLWGAAPDDGILEPRTLTELEQTSRFLHRSAALWEFASTAAVGEFSAPMLGWQRGLPGVWVYLMRERIESTPARDYLDAALQRRVRAGILRSLDQLRLRVALKGVANSVYVWPPSLRPTGEE